MSTKDIQINVNGPLKEIQTKCIRCGAPTQWKKSVLVNRCEFCGLPNSRASQYLGGVSGLFAPINKVFSLVPIPSKLVGTFRHANSFCPSAVINFSK